MCEKCTDDLNFDLCHIHCHLGRIDDTLLLLSGAYVAHNDSRYCQGSGQVSLMTLVFAISTLVSKSRHIIQGTFIGF